MPVNIGKKTPHGQAATEVSKTITKAGEPEPVAQEHEYTNEVVQLSTPYEVLEFGASFKMPVASYTMLEFSVRRTVPFNPVEKDVDTVFDETREWVEGKLNTLIAEQGTSEGEG